jgi:hypothetical protein
MITACSTNGEKRNAYRILVVWVLSFSPMSVLTLVKRRPLEYSNVDILFTLKKVQ